MRLALHIFLFLAFMDAFAILALLPGGDAVSDHGNLSGDSADADGEADAVSAQGNLLPGSDAVSADTDGGADAVSLARVISLPMRTEVQMPRFNKTRYDGRKDAKKTGLESM